MSTPAPIKDYHTKEKVTLRLAAVQKVYIDTFREPFKLNMSEAISKIIEQHQFQGLQTSSASLCEGCNACLKHGIVTPQGVLCITKRSVYDPIRKQYLSPQEAEACSRKPFNTPLDKKTREELQKTISDLEGFKLGFLKFQPELLELRKERSSYRKRERDLEAELDQVKQPFQCVLKEKEGLKIEVENVRNSLLAALTERDVLETDNQFLKTENKKLSENELLKENDSLHLQLSRASNEKADIAEEVLKLQALLKEERNQKSDIISKVDKTLKEIEQYMPLPRVNWASQLPVVDLELKAYMDSLKKTIQNFRGYLQTVAA